MTSSTHAFPTTQRCAALAAGLLAAFTVGASAPADRSLLAGEVDIEAPAPAPAPQAPPADEQTPQQSDQPGERKRTYDGPPRDELLPIERRLPA
jgi:hypothetical protein